MGGGVAIVPTAPERVRNRDSHFPYRFDSYFYYLTGFREPEAVLVIVAGEPPRSVLFCRERNPEREIWDGFRYGPEGAREAFGFDEAHSIARLDELLPGLLADCGSVYCHLGADAGWDARVMGWLNQVRAEARRGVAAPTELQDVHALLDEMRLVKDGSELALMRRAATIAAAAHRRAMRAARPGTRRVRDRGGAPARVPAPRRAGARPIPRSSPPASTRACCTTWRTTGCSRTARCC